MKTDIVPIIKNKTGDTSGKNNYRPIALVTATSKLFEMCLLEILQMYLITHDHQFGFKTKHSADMCIFTVKRIIKYYTGHNTPVYTCFPDASKAFDQVNHLTLFIKLNNSGISLLIVRILVFWYQTQQLCIKRGGGGSTSRFFTIPNGVLQGSILSPKIIALYMNGLTDELSNSYAGCYIQDKCINHIMYADDICLMAPTDKNLLDACHTYGAANYILFNPLKSVCIVYRPKYYKLFCHSVNIGSEPL